MNTALFDLYSNTTIETATDEEIDILFSQLECIEPPAYMVDSIMNAVARLPHYSDAVDAAEVAVAI